MDSCRLVIELPEDQQVSRGQELMSLLAEKQTHHAILDSKHMGKVDWNIIVKQTFIEVVIPDMGARRRTMSEPALTRFDKAEMPWKSIVSDKLQDKMSDVSTNDSTELTDDEGNLNGSIADNSVREDMGWSSDDEEDKEMLLPCQYVDPWWMPMGYDMSGTPQISPAGSIGFDQAGMAFDASAFAQMQWMEGCMGAVEYQCVDVTDAASQEWRTTVMIRNMPNNYTREMLLELVDEMGFAGTYDFAYLPVDFQSQAGLGYAFINFSSIADAHACFSQFEGFTNWKVPSEKVCTVTWSSPTQGLEAHIDRYRNSPVMHPSLPDEWKPVLLQQGLRIPFPPPTKPIKTPKVRQHPSSKASPTSA